jgi:hypothetical protein
MLTVAGLLKYHNKAELVSAINKGEITEKDLSRVYSSFRKRINAQVRNIMENSDIPFLEGMSPWMSKKVNLVTTNALVDQIAQGLRFATGKSYTIRQRKEQRRMAVAKLREHGIFINEKDWGEWRRFMAWFKRTEFGALYDSDSIVTQTVFNEEPTATSIEWEKAFLDWMKENDPDKYAQWVKTHGSIAR